MSYRHPPILNFLGAEALPPEGVKPRVAVIPVPLEVTVTYGRGAGQGPQAILEASQSIELYDDELDAEPWLLGIETLNYVSAGAADPQGAVEEISRVVSAVTADGMFPVLLGGEHTVTVGAVAALSRLYPDLHVVSFDAHADFRDSYQGCKLSHACAMRRASEYADVTAVGIRSVSREEVREMQGCARYRMIRAAEIEDAVAAAHRILREITGPVYLSVDLDGLDPSLMPAVGTPEPGGLSWQQLTSMIRELCRESTVIGADVVELAPIPGFVAPSFVAAKLVHKIIGYWGAYPQSKV